MTLQSSSQTPFKFDNCHENILERVPSPGSFIVFGFIPLCSSLVWNIFSLFSWPSWPCLKIVGQLFHTSSLNLPLSDVVFCPDQKPIKQPDNKNKEKKRRKEGKKSPVLRKRDGLHSTGLLGTVPWVLSLALGADKKIRKTKPFTIENKVLCGFLISSVTSYLTKLLSSFHGSPQHSPVLQPRHKALWEYFCLLFFLLRMLFLKISA